MIHQKLESIDEGNFHNRATEIRSWQTGRKIDHLLSLFGAVELEEDVAAVDVGLDVVGPHGDGLLVERVSLI